MDLATLVHQYYDAFMARFGETLPSIERADDRGTTAGLNGHHSG